MELLDNLSEKGFFLLFAGIFFFPLLVAVITVKHIFYNDKLADSHKLLWVTIVILLPLFGAIIYYFAGKKSYKNDQV